MKFTVPSHWLLYDIILLVTTTSTAAMFQTACYYTMTFTYKARKNGSPFLRKPFPLYFLFSSRVALPRKNLVSHQTQWIWFDGTSCLIEVNFKRWFLHYNLHISYYYTDNCKYQVWKMEVTFEETISTQAYYKRGALPRAPCVPSNPMDLVRWDILLN